MKVYATLFFILLTISDVFTEENLHYPRNIAESENLKLIWQAETHSLDSRNNNMFVQYVPEKSSKNDFGYFKMEKDLTLTISNDISNLFISEINKEDPSIFFFALLAEPNKVERDNWITQNIESEHVKDFLEKWNHIELFLIQESQRREKGYARIGSISIPPPEGLNVLDMDYGEDVSINGNNAFRERMRNKEKTDNTLQLRKTLGIYPDDKTYVFYEYGTKPY